MHHETLRPLIAEDRAEFRAHFERHRAESGRGEPHFLPFAPDDPEGPKGFDFSTLDRSLDEPGWQRGWVAVVQGGIVGHVDLKGDGLRAGFHRCELGIGVERAHRGGGLGRRLMETAIEFARGAPTLDWVDLRVFAHNAAGRALYRRLGFVELGTLVDRFRIGSRSVDDVIMTLSVVRPAS